MSKKNKIFLNCTEANHTCNKTQYNDASLFEKIKLNLHLLYCRACRKYSSNNAKLTKVMNNPEIEFLNTSEKDNLKIKFDQELAKQD